MLDMFMLEGKIVAVTGAGGQLGRELISAFTKCGAHAVGLDVIDNQDASDDFLPLDIRDRMQCRSTFKKIVQRYGNLDILVNNAGIGTFLPFEERSDDEFKRVIDVNLTGTFNCIQSFVELFDSNQFVQGAIINIGSVYGIVSSDFRIYTDCGRINSEVYSATKAAVIHMSKYYAVHLAHRGIRVNCVSPGGIFNPEKPQGDGFISNYSHRCPMGRMAEYHEIVGGVLFLASKAASYVNGHNLVIDGGMTAW